MPNTRISCGAGARMRTRCRLQS